MKTLYNEYFQKSRIFLYPALQIKRGSSITPIQTYVSWKDNIKYGDKRLVALYHLRDDKEYKLFEKSNLLGNKLFESFIEGVDGRGIYVFNMELLKESWDIFLRGKYSKLSTAHKKLITDFYRGSPNFSFIESYLNPTKYYTLYSNLLGVEEKILKEVGELADPTDLDKETLEFSVKSIEFETSKSNTN